MGADSENPMPRPHVSVEVTTDHSRFQYPGAVIASRYKLLEQIGEGGMGAVWVADQSDPVRRRVALKLIKPGMDSRQVLSRFEAERQALALMDHPNIAKVYDGGMTEEGRPFFAMEYVKGVPITGYCDQAKLNIHDRLRLFVPICQAVQHAHQKGIIHRDLKPSNILVCLYDGRPVPKLLDFGLAKAISQPLTEHTLYTAHGLMVGTPTYMSPEQAEFNNLDVDTRTDIYSLGVILYELLTGTTPLEKQRVKAAALDEILKLIKEEEPIKPSTKVSSSASLHTIATQRGMEPAQLSRIVRGDLDWIVMKSLEKERGRRYETANGLARDIERYLNDEPIEARPPSLVYKLSKLARRNKRSLVSAAVIAVILLAALTIAAGSIGWVVRDRQTRQAVVERNALLLLDEALSALNADDVTGAQSLLRQSQALLSTIQTASDVAQRIRHLKADLDFLDEFEKIQYQRAVGVKDEDFDFISSLVAYQKAFKDHDLDLATRGPLEAAQRIRSSPIKQQLIAALDDWAFAAPSADHVKLLAIAREADTDPWRNQLRHALERGSREELKRLASDADAGKQPVVVVALLGRRLAGLGEREAAIDLLRRAQRRSPQNFWMNHHLGQQLVAAALTEEAAAFLRSAVSKTPDSAIAHQYLATAYRGNGKLADAESEYREAVRLAPLYVTACHNLAVVLQEQRKTADAETALREAIRIKPNDAPAHAALANLLIAIGKADEADASFRQSIAFAPDDFLILENYTDALKSRGKLSQAEQECRDAVRRAPADARAHQLLGRVFCEQKKLSEAQAAFREALRLKPDDWLSHALLAMIQMEQNNMLAAEAQCREAIRLDPAQPLPHMFLGAALAQQRKWSEAEAALREGLRINPYFVPANSFLFYILQQQGRRAELREELRFISNSPVFSSTDPFGKDTAVIYWNGRWMPILGASNIPIWLPPGMAASANRGTQPATAATPEQVAKQAVQERPNDAEAHLELALILRENGNFSSAETSFREAIRLRPNYAEAYAGLARTLQFMGKHADAKAAAQEAVRLDSQSPEAQHQLAFCLAKQGNYAASEAAYREELRLQPDRASSQEHFGWVLRRLGNLKEAEKTFAEARRLDPITFGAPAKAAEYRAKDGLLWEAAHEFALAFEQGPEDLASGMRAGMLMLLVGDRAAYQRICEQMLQRAEQTKDLEALRRTVHTCVFSDEPVGTAQQHKRLIDQVIAGSSNQHWANREAGLVAYRRGDRQEALNACRRSRELVKQGNFRTAYTAQNLVIESMAYWRLSKQTEARAAYYESSRINSSLYPYAPDYLGPNWIDWIIYEPVRQQAADLLGILADVPTDADHTASTAADGDWKTAARDLVAASQRSSADSVAWMNAAVALILADDMDGYRSHCREMIDRFSMSETWNDHDRVTKTCLLLPDGVDRSRLPVDRLQTVLNDGTAPANLKPWVYADLGLAAYRSGDFSRAIEWAEKIQDLSTPVVIRVLGHLIAALVRQKQGDAAAAHQALTEAARLIDAQLPKLSSGEIDYRALLRRDPTYWHNWIIPELLRREAAASIAGPPQK
jgi:tetratricopeptide (TPR) repeat protein/tRNA A-37 threonylcarbamoyl transferase component Bud32